MKAMPLPFEELQGKKGVLNFSSFSSLTSDSSFPHNQNWRSSNKLCYVGSEPTSVLEARRSLSPPTSSSTTMASRGSKGDGSCSTNVSENPSSHAVVVDTCSAEKCALQVEDWEGVMSESPGQDQSILRLIMGDMEDPSSGLNNILQSNEPIFNGAGFGVVDQQGFDFENVNVNANVNVNVTTCGGMVMSHNNNATEPIFSSSVSNNPLMMTATSPLVFNSEPQVVVSSVEEKLNRNQVQFSENPSFFMPLGYPQLQEQQVFSHHHHQPQAKRLLCDTIGQGYEVTKGAALLDSGQEMFGRRQQQHQQHQLQLPLNTQNVHHHHQWQSLLEPPVKQQKVSSLGDDFTTQQLQQTIIDLIFKAAEHIEAGNPANAQGILARLNHQLSPIGKPFQRAAFYMKEALQLLLHSNGQSLLAFSPISFIFKIGAYKSFSEISPVLQFANFTCNQALIEAVERFDRIHIIDFDIGFGVQWASFMQELALRNGGAPSLKVTAVVSSSTCDEIELSFTRESLKQYAKEINISFELNVMSIESLNSASWPLPGRFSDTEAIAVNLPVSCFSNYPTSFPMALCFVKQLMPKIVVTLDRNCDRIDVPFPHNLIHALQSYTALLESLDAVNVNLDVLQKIERHFVQPAIEKIIFGRQHGREKLPPWKNLLLTSGFSPFSFSNSTEAQAECLVQRAPVRGFQVDRKHSSLTLCWQRKELISISTWRC